MDDSTFDELAHQELQYIEQQFLDVDPDEVDLDTSGGVIKLELRDGVTVVLNTQRPAHQLWLAAVASAWHFDYDAGTGRWLDGKSGHELRATIRRVINERIGVDVEL